MPSTLNLLVIEDNADDLALIERELSRQGLRASCTQASHPDEIDKALRSAAWDAVLVDYHVPGVGFPELIAALAARLPDVPVILVSGGVGEEQAVDLLKSGITDFVLKNRLARVVPALQRALAEAAERHARRLAERKLRESESRLSAFLESAHSVACVRDLDGRFVSVNRYAEQTLGMSRAEMLGRTLFDLFPRDFAEASARNDRAVIGSGESMEFEETVAIGGAARIFSSVRFPIRDAGGQICAIGSLCTDVTTQRREHAALADAEARWQFALDGSDLGVWDWNPQTGEVLCSPRWKSMLGYSADEIVGRIEAITALVHPDDLARVTEAIERHLRGQTDSFKFELRMRCRDGSDKWVLSRGKVIERDGHGKPERMVGTHADITGRRVLEMSLKESEARANLIFDSAPEATLLVDSRGIIVRSNRSADQSFGYPPGDLIGKSYEMLVPEELRERHRAHHAYFMSRPMPRPMARGRNLQARRLDASVFAAEISLVPIMVGDEQQVIVTILDISLRKQTELDLRRYERIVEVSGELLAMVDRDLNYIVANPAYAAHAGATPESLRGRNLRDVFGARLFDEIEPRLDAVLAGDEQRFRTERTFDDGRHYVLDGEYRPFRVDGAVQGIVASLRDVTAVVETELLLERAQSTAKVGNWTYEAAGDVFILSRQSQRMLGRPSQVLPGAEMVAMLHPDDRARLHAEGMAAIRHGKPFDIEYRYVVNGAIVHVHVVVELVRDADGRMTRAIGVMQDISDVREAQLALQAQHEQLEHLVAERTAELRQQQSYLHALIDNFPFRVWLKDTGGRYLAANRSNLALEIDDVPDRPGSTDHDLRPREIADRYRGEDEQVMRERRPSIREVVRDGAAGTLWFETYKAPVLGGDGAVLGTVGYVRDITQQKALDAAREAALQEAQRLARVRSEFVANMSHEIRTPLSAMLGLAEVGLRDDLGRRSAQVFARILESGQLLLRVINDILDFSKIEAGKFSVESVPFDPCEAIDRAVDYVRAQARAKGLAFEVDEAADLPASCLGDALRVSQVLVNLLSNAVKFTTVGEVGVSALREGQWLRFEVVDSGIGMHPDQVGRLFRPFEQADTSTTRRFGGTGLGLAISHRLVELMGGELTVQSQPGKGSRFTLRLPLAGATDAVLGESLAIDLVGLEQTDAGRLAAALAARGVAARIASAAAALHDTADLLVIGCRALDDRVGDLTALAALDSAIYRGRRIAVACNCPLPCAPTERLSARAVPIAYPLRARHLIGAARIPARDRRAAAAGDRLRGVRVLAAEDNELNRLVLSEIMRLEGAHLSLAEDGERALDLLQSLGSQAFDIALTDIQMPGIDGYETARRMRELAPALPVIGLTAHAMREERERCLVAGMVEHLAKPIDIEALVAAVLRHLPPSTRPAPAAGTVQRAVDEVTPPGSEPAPATLEAIDWQALARRFPDRSTFIDRLADTLLKTHGQTSARLRAAAPNNDRETIVFLAHSLKGVAGSIMASHLLAQARDTEEAGSQDSADLGPFALSLADALDEALEAARARLARR